MHILREELTSVEIKRKKWGNTGVETQKPFAVASEVRSVKWTSFEGVIWSYQC